MSGNILIYKDGSNSVVGIVLVRRLSILVKGVRRLGGRGRLLQHVLLLVVIILHILLVLLHGRARPGSRSLVHETRSHQLLWHLSSQIHHPQSHPHGSGGRCGG